MIDNTNTKLESIINGQTNATISYDINAVRGGDGIGLDRRTPNRVVINNVNQGYNLSVDSLRNVFSSNVIPLTKFSNYVAHQNNAVPIVLTKDLSIYIDDSKVAWTNGQVLRLVFEDQIVPGAFDIKLYTDKSNLMGFGEYGIQIAIFNDIEFTPSNNTPIFDIMCLDINTLSFKVDKIR